MEDTNMKTQMKVLFLFIFLLALSVSSFSVVTTLTFKGGISGYQGDIKDDVEMNPMVGLSYEVWLKHFISIGIHPYYTSLGAGKSPDYNFSSHAGGADFLLKLRPFEINIGDGAINKIAPYIVGGGGIVNYFPEIKGAVDPTDPNFVDYDYIWQDQDMVDASYKWNAGVLPTIGGGLTFMTKHGFNIDLGIQWNNTLSDFVDGAEGGDKDDSFWMGYLGLAFNFETKKDKDGDGILDKDDKDPTHAEDFDGFEDRDGAPDLDNDNDGIPDVSDKAPGTDETVSKGINTKEDMDGFQDKDGVPDPDNDNDGIIDTKDKAPGTDDTVKKGINTKETKNGFMDEDGIPDEVPVVEKPKPPVVEQPKPVVEVKKEIPLNLAPVYFQTNSDELSKDDIAILDAIVVGLQGNPDVKLEVVGNTDNIGGADLNKKLSMQRAQEVKNYLVSKGIDEKRLLVIGNGPDKPVDVNTTPEGRAKNRRTEFTKIK
jgi:outer membrane protein OmpA-like peptidoglycan-associated protein